MHSIQDEDVHYFTYRDLNRTTVSLLLARSLEDLVDADNPRNVLKFKVSCDHDDGEDIVSVGKQITGAELIEAGCSRPE